MDRLSFSYLETNYFTISEYFTRSKRLQDLIDESLEPEIKNQEIIQDINIYIKKRYYLKHKLLENDITNGTIKKIINKISPKKIVSLDINQEKEKKKYLKSKFIGKNKSKNLNNIKLTLNHPKDPIFVDKPNTPKNSYYSINVMSNW